jgi:hypothetical protein
MDHIPDEIYSLLCLPKLFPRLQKLRYYEPYSPPGKQMLQPLPLGILDLPHLTCLELRSNPDVPLDILQAISGTRVAKSIQEIRLQTNGFTNIQGVFASFVNLRRLELSFVWVPRFSEPIDSQGVHSAYIALLSYSLHGAHHRTPGTSLGALKNLDDLTVVLPGTPSGVSLLRSIFKDVDLPALHDLVIAFVLVHTGFGIEVLETGTLVFHPFVDSEDPSIHVPIFSKSLSQQLMRLSIFMKGSRGEKVVFRHPQAFGELFGSASRNCNVFADFGVP